MDVTDEVLKSAATYGSSTSFQDKYYSAQKTLNYGTGGSINKPDTETIEKTVNKLNYKDEVGLFGLENYFVQITLDREPNTYHQITIENNLGGNKYENIWLDISLLDKNKQTAAEVTIKGGDFFYVGVHARNTRRLPYDFDVNVTAL